VSRKPRWRAARRQEMRARGTKPPLRWEVWRIRVSPLLTVPDWARQASIRGLPCAPNEVWLRSWGAELLLRIDRVRGGYSEFAKTEFRRCDVCYRPLIGSEAEKRRLSIEADPAGRTLANGSVNPSAHAALNDNVLGFAPAHSGTPESFYCGATGT
jgi:hypothetical protein